jgi:hypothetical protein
LFPSIHPSVLPSVLPSVFESFLPRVTSSSHPTITMIRTKQLNNTYKILKFTQLNKCTATQEILLLYGK